MHAEFGHVESLAFHLGSHAHGLYLVHDEEDHISRAERPQRAQRGPAELAYELAGISMQQARNTLAGVSEVSGGADAVPAGTISAIGEDADAHRPQPAAEAVHRNGPAGVVDLGHALVEKRSEERRV